MLIAPSQEKMLLQSHHGPLCHPPWFVEIAHAMWGEESAERGPTTVIGIPQGSWRS